MVKDIYSKKELTSTWFNQLQETICYEFEKIEYEFGKKTKKKSKNFVKKTWKKSEIKNEGGGTYALRKIEEFVPHCWKSAQSTIEDQKFGGGSLEEVRDGGEGLGVDNP